MRRGGTAGRVSGPSCGRISVDEHQFRSKCGLKRRRNEMAIISTVKAGGSVVLCVHATCAWRVCRDEACAKCFKRGRIEGSPLADEQTI